MKLDIEALRRLLEEEYRADQAYMHVHHGLPIMRARVRYMQVSAAAYEAAAGRCERLAREADSVRERIAALTAEAVSTMTEQERAFYEARTRYSVRPFDPIALVQTWRAFNPEETPPTNNVETS